MFGFLFGRHQGRPQGNSYVAATYRGCADGWAANGAPRSLSEAQRLSVLIGRIRPDFITRPVAA